MFCRRLAIEICGSVLCVGEGISRKNPLFCSGSYLVSRGGNFM